MKKDIGILFDALLLRYIKTIEKNIKARIKKARDKEKVKADIKAEFDFIIHWEQANENKALFSGVFLEQYKRGEDTGKILAHIRKVFGEDVEDILPFTRIENGQHITLYLSEEEKAIKQLALNDRKLMKFFIRFIANLEIEKRLPDLLSGEQPQEIRLQNHSAIKWTASKDNKNEFVQLIYGLYQAGFINDGKGEITKIVEELAEVFGVSLGKNWQSNHSASIHKAKHDYQPLIFHKIRQAYEAYTQSLIEDKKKTK